MSRIELPTIKRGCAWSVDITATTTGKSGGPEHSLAGATVYPEIRNAVTGAVLVEPAAAITGATCRLSLTIAQTTALSKMRVALASVVKLSPTDVRDFAEGETLVEGDPISTD